MRKILFIDLIVIIIFCFYPVQLIADEIDDDESCEYVKEYIETSNNVGENFKINSRIAVAYDRENNRVIWGKDAEKKTAMASTTKIMTAIVTLENANLEDQVEISAKAAATGGSRLGLKKGDKISLRDLLYGLMLRSGNDAAVAIAEHVSGSVAEFSNLMNDKAKELNLKNTHFVTPHGLDNPEHYTTATELAKLADYALDNKNFQEIVGTKNYTITINGYPKNLNNTNELLGYMPNVYGVKTGFTNNAGRCLVTSINKNNMDIITVVIQADTKKDRTKDSINIINYIYDNYEKITISEIVDEQFLNWCDVNKKRIHIDKASSNNIELFKDSIEYESLIIEKNKINEIRTEINAIYNFEAPVNANTLIGEQKVFIGNELFECNKIYIRYTIERISVQEYFKKCLYTLTK